MHKFAIYPRRIMESCLKQERQQHLRAQPYDDIAHGRLTYRKDCTPNVRPHILLLRIFSLETNLRRSSTASGHLVSF